jgi:hypothetical protein
LALQLQPSASHPQHWLRMLPNAIRQFLVITESISEFIIIPVLKATHLLSSHPLETPGLGLVIQQDGRMFMFQARPKALDRKDNEAHGWRLRLFDFIQCGEPQSSSASRFTAGSTGFLILSQWSTRPER